MNALHVKYSSLSNGFSASAIKRCLAFLEQTYAFEASYTDVQTIGIDPHKEEGAPLFLTLTMLLYFKSIVDVLNSLTKVNEKKRKTYLLASFVFTYRINTVQYPITHYH